VRKITAPPGQAGLKVNRETGLTKTGKTIMIWTRATETVDEKRLIDHQAAGVAMSEDCGSSELAYLWPIGVGGMRIFEIQPHLGAIASFVIVGICSKLTICGKGIAGRSK
jgi:hypothetical protein